MFSPVAQPWSRRWTTGIEELDKWVGPHHSSGATGPALELWILGSEGWQEGHSTFLFQSDFFFIFLKFNLSMYNLLYQRNPTRHGAQMKTELSTFFFTSLDRSDGSLWSCFFAIYCPP